MGRIYPWVRLDITQGAIEVTHAYLMAKGPRVAAIAIDCASKYPVIGCTGSTPTEKKDKKGYPIYLPMLMLYANENTLGVIKDKEDAYTEIAFPEYEGYTVWATDGGRYTVTVCLLKY